MKQVIFFILGLLIVFAQQSVLSQSVQSEQDRAAKAAQQAEDQRQERNRLNGYNEQGFMTQLGPPLPPDLYKGRKKEIENLKKAYEKTKDTLVVPKSYYEQYKAFLNDKKIRLARLQTDKHCYSKNITSAESLEKCADVVPLPGDGSLYSFKSKFNYKSSFNYQAWVDIEYQLRFNVEDNWWNIHFINGKFVVQNNSVRGIIAEIGDVDLRTINLSSREIAFLAAFKEKKTPFEVEEQNRNLKNGISFNNIVYSNSASVKLNSTYVLRSIDYSSLKRRAPADKHADVTIALKVIGQENDGSVIIIWKELKSGRLPK